MSIIEIIIKVQWIQKKGQSIGFLLDLENGLGNKRKMVQEQWNEEIIKNH
ncbi:unnamed protein product [Paramecium sonneborni]|uniref:Uncharacterized protein n=1 Tax=Paramecium sonneborni TaxID=65129 RepID=A0A8S1LJW1_9CILI|nr:unnamed protein product [Paramecium sonneborni]